MPKPKIPNQRKANIEHKKRTERYALLIQQVYDRMAQEAARLAVIAGADTSRPFSFADYPLTKEAVKRLQTQLMNDVGTIIMSGTSEEWKESNLAQDLVAKKVLTAYTGTSNSGEEYSRYFETNPDRLKAFQQRKENGMNLSSRVWNLSEQYKPELEEAITAAIAPGTSAMELAAQVKKYLKEPDKRFRRIKEKMEDGTIKWHLSKNAKAYHPGQGVYRSSARNAQRLARTEINMAYRTAEQERWKQFDFVVGYEVKTTQNGHHVEDMCDMLAGKYPKTFKFTGWHPQCMCYCIPILKTEEEFWSLDDDVKSVNEVTDVPQNFKEWIRNNEDRINAAEKRGTQPYFIRDNRDDVDVILNARNASKTTEVLKRQLPKLPEKPSQEDIQNFINILASNEGWFDQYNNGVSVIIDEKLRGAVASADRKNATIYLKPSESLFNALYRISNGEKLTYENANNLATLWHEINHMRHIGIDKATGGPYSGGIGASAMELANEYYSRKTLPKFFNTLGYDEMPFPNMVNRRNTGYNNMVELYDYVIKRKFGLDENAVLKRIEQGLFNEPYNNQVTVLMDALKSGGLKAKDSQIEKLVLKMCQYGKEPTPDKLGDFIDKMKYSIELPQSNQYRGNIFARTLDNIQTSLISRQFKGIDSFEELSSKASILLSKAVGNDVSVVINPELMTMDIAKAHLTELVSITRDYNIRQGNLSEIRLGYRPLDKEERGVTSYIPSQNKKIVSLTNIVDNRDIVNAIENSRCDKNRLQFSLASHEGGHLLLSYNAPLNKEMAMLRHTISQIWEEYKREFESFVSKGEMESAARILIGKYGHNIPSEFMAECFQEYRNSSNPSKYAKLIGELLDSYFKK